MKTLLTKVTITGADDNSDPRELAELSKEFPFAEWGILVSGKQTGTYRFPSTKWIDHLCEVASENAMNLSTHVCGRWVREMFVGSLDWSEVPKVIQICQRVQINTHAEPHVSTVGLFERLTHCPALNAQFIFQWDGVNDHLTLAAHLAGYNVAALFDTSGGAGRLPGEWPESNEHFPCGYAGGLSPDNVVEQISRIEAVCHRPTYWIDMERRVRSDDDSRLDMKKVRKVLELCAPLVSEAPKPVEVFTRTDCPFNYCDAPSICKPQGSCRHA